MQWSLEERGLRFVAALAMSGFDPATNGAIRDEYR
jgi:hypothetical protein